MLIAYSQTAGPWLILNASMNGTYCLRVENAIAVEKFPNWREKVNHLFHVNSTCNDEAQIFNYFMYLLFLVIDSRLIR